MAEVVRGTGIVWGADGYTFTGGVVSDNDTSVPRSTSYTRDSQKAELPNGDGENIGQVYYNLKKTFRITVVPTGKQLSGTVTAADASLLAHSLTSGTIVTLADVEGLTDDGYVVQSSTVNRTPDDFVSVDLEIEAYDDNEIDNTIT